MPHLTIEYSANLRSEGRMSELTKALAEVLRAEKDGERNVYPLGGIRVRAIACEDYCIAGGEVPDAGFVHATLRIARGRSEPVRKATGDHLLAVMKDHFAALFEQRGLALSLVVEELNEFGSWKHNNLHQRLRKDP